MISGHATVKVAASDKASAYEFIEKPFQKTRSSIMLIEVRVHY